MGWSLSPPRAFGGRHGGRTHGRSITGDSVEHAGLGTNAATAIDGYPLAQQAKRHGHAVLRRSANAIGGIIGTVSVLAILPIAKDIVLLFGPPNSSCWRSWAS